MMTVGFAIGFAVGFAGGLDLFHVYHDIIDQAGEVMLFQSVPLYTATIILRNSFNTVRFMI